MYNQLILGSVFVIIGISIYFYIMNTEIEKPESYWIGYFCGIGFVIFGLFLIILQIFNFSIYKWVFFFMSNNK
jgi:hypothetical protein